MYHSGHVVLSHIQLFVNYNGWVCTTGNPCLMTRLRIGPKLRIIMNLIPVLFFFLTRISNLHPAFMIL